MSSFEKAIPVVLKHEGGFVNDPADPGGATNYGISLRYVLSDLAGLSDEHGPLHLDLDGDGDVDADDIRKMTQETAVAIYRVRWWDRFGYGRLVDQGVATKAFDVAVNMGAKRAHALLQLALQDCGYKAIAADGSLGPATLKSANDCEARELLLAYCRRQELKYQEIAHAKPALAKFLPGWELRARWPFRQGEYLT